MSTSRGRPVVALAVAVLAVGVAVVGCTRSGSGASEGPAIHRGGTLTIMGLADLDHMDPAAAYRRPAYLLHRAITRQLLQFSSDAEVVADLAERVPAAEAGGRSYTVRLRDRVRWDTNPPRDITADDVVRGVKRLCYPGRPVEAPRYLETVIAGMARFCAGFTAVPSGAAAIRRYLEANDVPGLQAVDRRTVRFTLERPAADFLHLLALPAAAPVPAEALHHLPDSFEFRRNYIASGPYRIASYTPAEGLTLERNPAWRPETDPLRRAYVDRIEIVLGADEGVVQERLEAGLGAGSADLAWDVTVPVEEVPRLLAARDRKLTLVADGGADPYLAVNLASPSARGALGRLAVRQALNYAVDKQALVDLYGGPALRQPLGQVLTPPIAGHRPQELYATAGHRGDAGRARRLLVAAGYPDGLRLRLLHRTAGRHPSVAAVLATSLRRAGIRVELQPVGTETFYRDFLRSPAATSRGEWDLALVGWAPDWPRFSARSIFVPLFDGRGCGRGSANKLPGTGSANWACYDDAQVNRLIDTALAAPTVGAAAKTWAEADAAVMADAPFVPLLTSRTPIYHSARVRGAAVHPLFANYDPTNLWLAG